MEMQNYHFVSLGCPKNLVDSQVMIGKMNSWGAQIVKEPAEADVIIVNTCSFIQLAREESVDTILEMARYKDKSIGRASTLVVSGCFAQMYKDQVEKALPEVDLVIGTGEYHRISELLQMRKDGTLPQKTFVGIPSFIHTEKDPRVQTGQSYFSYLKVSEGCNKNCAYCIIPQLRGRTRSRTVESLVEEATRLAAAGTKEILLIAQDLTEYGMDQKYAFDLPMLLRELVKIEDLKWIRLLYTYPDQLDEEVYQLIKNEEKIVKYLDMPIQHLNNDVLKRMNRRVDKQKIFDLVSRFRAEIPGFFIRSSIIAGFPGETEEQFEELYEGLKELEIDHLGVFAYSFEESTKSGKMDGQLDEKTKKARADKIRKLHGQISKKRLARLVGQTIPVLVEGVHPETDLLLKGRHYGQAPEIDGSVIINDGFAHPGELVLVKIEESHEFDLVGGIVQSLDTPTIEARGSFKERFPAVTPSVLKGHQ